MVWHGGWLETRIWTVWTTVTETPLFETSILKTDKEPDEALLETLRDSLLKDKANVRENSLKTLKPDRKRSKGKEKQLLPVIAGVSSMLNDTSDQRQIQMVYSAR